MFDFIGKILFKRTPESIQSDDPQALQATGLDENPEDAENLAVANALVTHLNEIEDWKERVQAIDYLAGQIQKETIMPSFVTSDEQLINSITMIGGTGGTVDFELVKTCISVVFDMYDTMAISAVAGINNA